METTDYKGFKIRIVQAENPSNPIEEWDGNVRYALTHRKYSLQNDTDLNTSDYGSWDEVKQALIKKYRPLAILPVYMYDHSGQTISTSPFSCRWDSGQLGFAFINKECLKEWGYKSRKGFEKCAKQTLEQAIKDNVALYDDYIQGNVWGYEVMDENDDVMDSCWGYYGDSGIKEAMREAKSIVDYKVKEESQVRYTQLNLIL